MNDQIRIAIMQPYFFPYIGYWQLINAVDKIIIYDDIQYTKKGWINRNRILVEQKDAYISLSLKKDSDYLDIRERYLADDYIENNKKIIRRIESAYQNAPYFKVVFPLIEACLGYQDKNLFKFLLNTILKTCEFLSIKTPIVVSSTLLLEKTELKGKNKVLNLCKVLDASQYVNLPGGKKLYDSGEFARNNLKLEFLVPLETKYKQGGEEYMPWLSIIDVMMFNSKEQVFAMLEEYVIE